MSETVIVCWEWSCQEIYLITNLYQSRYHVVPMISSSWSYRSGLIFHHQWLNWCNIRMRFCLASSISHAQNPRSTFFCLSVCGNQFPCFVIVLNDFKRSNIACWVTLEVRATLSCVWHVPSSNTTYVRCLNVFKRMKPFSYLTQPYHVLL